MKTRHCQDLLGLVVALAESGLVVLQEIKEEIVIANGQSEVLWMISNI